MVHEALGSTPAPQNCTQVVTDRHASHEGAGCLALEDQSHLRL
jgi:hypothetical protein